MFPCCVKGCTNHYSHTTRVKFFSLPSGRKMFHVKRRRLWIQVIEKANGYKLDLNKTIRICAAHFITGEVSLDPEKPDFAPSVFTCAKRVRGLKEKVQTPKEKVQTPKEKVQTPKEKVQTPKEKVQTQKEKVQTPKEKVQTPKEKVQTPKEKVQTPKEKVQTPKEKVQTPKEQVQSQKEQVPSPKEQVPSPKEQVPSPKEQVPSPKEQVPSPKEQVQSPKEQVPSPKEKIRRKRRQRRGKKWKNVKKPSPDSGDSVTKPQDQNKTEIENEPPAQTPSPQKIETNEEVENKTDTIQQQKTFSPKQMLKSLIGPDRMYPVVVLKTITTPSGDYQCELCGQIFTGVSEFFKHKQLYEEQKVCISVQPDVPTPTPDVELHQELPQELPQVELSFPCNMCDRSFPTTQNLKRHKLLHVKDGRKCSKCGVLFCRRHNHILFQPVAKSQTKLQEDSSNEKHVDTSSSSECSGLETDKQNHPQSSPGLSLPSLGPKPPSLASLTRIPASELVKPSRMPRPPSPIFSFLTNLEVSPRLKEKNPDYLSVFVQPHLPYSELPPALRVFSSQKLTSVFLDVQRNNKYIMGKPQKTKFETFTNVEPRAQEMMHSDVKMIKEVKTEKIAYDLEVEI